MRTTTVRFRDWPWHARLVEKLYRLTHGGRIRTLVLNEDQRFADEYFKSSTTEEPK